jgi:ABC-type branched-subunit amino acid transport system substrate-binding protein
MSSQITQFMAAGVNAIALTVAPAQTASAAGVAAAQGLNVPIIGSNPVWSPALLAGPAAGALKANLIFSSPVSTFDKNPALLAAYKAKYPNATTSLGVVFGAGASEVMRQILDKACASGDLTRAGVLKAKQSLTKLETGGLVVPLDFSKSGNSPSRQSFILKVADVPGGASALTDAIEAPEVAGLS